MNWFNKVVVLKTLYWFSCLILLQQMKNFKLLSRCAQMHFTLLMPIIIIIGRNLLLCILMFFFGRKRTNFFEFLNESWFGRYILKSSGRFPMKTNVNSVRVILFVQNKFLSESFLKHLKRVKNNFQFKIRKKMLSVFHL